MGGNSLDQCENVNGTFAECAAPTGEVTVTQLKALPSSEWDAAIAGGEPPHDLDEFERNLRRSLDFNADKISKQLVDNAGLLASGRLDTQLNNRADGDPRAYADSRFPIPLKGPNGMEDFRELYRDVFEHVHANGLSPDEAKAYAQEQFEAVRDGLGQKIDAVMDTLRNPEPGATPEMAPDAVPGTAPAGGVPDRTGMTIQT